MHSSCMPPVAHSNLKASNVLLNEELRPRLSDGGLAVLKPMTSNEVKLKVSFHLSSFAEMGTPWKKFHNHLFNSIAQGCNDNSMAYHN